MFFNETIVKELTTYLAGLLEFAGTSTDEQTEHLTDNIKLLYDQMDLNPPQIVFCHGPMQQVIFPALVGLMFKFGRENSATSKFQPNPADNPIVNREWAQLWVEAHSFIDWNEPNEFSDGVGSVLNKRIRRITERTLKAELIVQVDKQIGPGHTEALELRFATEARIPFQALRMLIPHGVEQRNTWSNFVYRLPGHYVHKLDVDRGDHDRELPLSKDGLKEGTWLGAADWSWLASYDFARLQLACQLDQNADKLLTLFMELSRAATSYLFCEHCCFVFSKPREVFFDDQWRFHHSEQPAIYFLDGTQVFYWHGVEVDEQIIVNPRSLKVHQIENERNIELRRIMIERYGLGNFIRESAAKKISEDDCGVLYRKECPGDEPILVVKVYNSTPEVDGTQRTYFLRVPPGTRTAREGVAWSFHLGEFQYKPKSET